MTRPFGDVFVLVNTTKRPAAKRSRFFTVDQNKNVPKGTSRILTFELPLGSAVAGNGNLSGEDQLVDINGLVTDDLHAHHLLSCYVMLLVLSNQTAFVCHILFQI